MNKKMMLFQLQDGQTVIGEIIEPTESFLNIIQNQMDLPFAELQVLIQEGIWVKRDQHVTYLANELIKLKRPSTVADKETSNRS